MMIPDSLRILVVEDDPFMRMTLRRLLCINSKPVVEEADDGESALERIVAFAPDVVLCDFYMTPMNGLQFLEKLRAHADASLRSTPVIVLTTNAEKASIVDAARLQADGYLVKPVSPKQLASRIAIAVGRARSRAVQRQDVVSRRPGATARDARILIVDDETRDIDAACAALRGGGFHAIESTSVPSEVPAICSRFAPDIVLLDLDMPD